MLVSATVFRDVLWLHVELKMFKRLGSTQHTRLFRPKQRPTGLCDSELVCSFARLELSSPIPVFVCGLVKLISTDIYF